VTDNINRPPISGHSPFLMKEGFQLVGNMGDRRFIEARVIKEPDLFRWDLHLLNKPSPDTRMTLPPMNQN